MGLFFSRVVSAPNDLVFADFEGETYGDWTVEGDAFGPGPAKGTLKGQMPVSGFQGKRLVNSFFNGDGTTGKLTSPKFKIERDFITFLIGGGGHEGKTCMNLLLDGKVIRTATGLNTQPGGSEELSLAFWEVKEFLGKSVQIQIVDAATGGWGHINVDQIVFSDQKPKIVPLLANARREIKIEKKYLLLPIRNGAKVIPVDVEIDGKNVREFDAEIAPSKEKIDFWAFLDVTAFKGKTAVLKLRNLTEEGLNLIAQGDEIPGEKEFYREALRPQFHFSQKIGWNNDPNGMVYYDGEWHLYFQHNPYGWKWGNMHWGHAVSRDLVHWEQLPISIYNPRRGDWAFSGGAVVDEENTTGWQTGKEKVIVASWTSTGRGECLSYSTDRGRTFTEFEGNPVVKHQGRDPKIIWYTPGKHWVMAVYDESKDQPRAISFYTSKDMKKWELQSKINGYYECPEFFELPIDGNPEKRRWVLLAADAKYTLGSFDGKTFKPEHEGKHQVHFGEYYASQLFSNAPNHRKIQIGWARINTPNMPFNQSFSFPHELSLRTTRDGVRLFAEPVKEIEKLHQKTHSLEAKGLSDSKAVSLKLDGELFDFRAEIELGQAKSIVLEFANEQIDYDCIKQRLENIPLPAVDGKLTLQILVDRPMLEISGNRGRVYLTLPRFHPGAIANLTVKAIGGEAKLLRLDAHELKSIWKK
jgi:fructan beta-fructosidase